MNNNNTSTRSKARAFVVNVLKTLEAPMRSHAQSSYRSLDGLHADRDAVTWYWRVTALASSVMILGGFLMLPATYVEASTLRVNQTAVGIFGIAILTAGFSFSALLTFTIRNPLFQADAVHQPCGVASAVGLLTVFYNFIVSSSYTWKTPTLLLAIAAGISTIVYAGLFLLSHRRISQIRSRPAQPSSTLPLTSASPARTSFASPATPYEPSALGGESINDRRPSTYQPPGYYENYIRNMYPTSTATATAPGPSTGDLGYDPHSISEEEMQRQQMLMLLLANDNNNSNNSHPAATQQQSSTFHIDWQDADESPAHGYYAPGAGTGSSSSGVGTGGSWPAPPQQQEPLPEQSSAKRWTNRALKPWDGVWRGVTRREEQQSGPQPQLQAQPSQQQLAEGRDQRRREIELGYR